MKPELKSLDRPDERPDLPRSSTEVVTLDGHSIMRLRLEEGWRWSNDWRPLLKTTSCRVHHDGVIVSGTLHFEMDDGSSVDCTPGTVYSVPPGHDAWVVGDQPVHAIHWSHPSERRIGEAR
jgi:hypothetical protein